jgi:hypothetical protein
VIQSDKPLRDETIISSLLSRREEKCAVDLLGVFIKDSVNLKESAVIIAKEQNAKIVGWIEPLNFIQYQFKTNFLNSLSYSMIIKKIDKIESKYEFAEDGILECVYYDLEH